MFVTILTILLIIFGIIEVYLTHDMIKKVKDKSTIDIHKATKAIDTWAVCSIVTFSVLMLLIIER